MDKTGNGNQNIPVSWNRFNRKHVLTFLASSEKSRFAEDDILSSLSSKQMAISLICPFTFNMSFKMRCVRMVTAVLRTSTESSRNLKQNRVDGSIQNSREICKKKRWEIFIHKIVEKKCKRGKSFITNYQVIFKKKTKEEIAIHQNVK